MRLHYSLSSVPARKSLKSFNEGGVFLLANSCTRFFVGLLCLLGIFSDQGFSVKQRIDMKLTIDSCSLLSVHSISEGFCTKFKGKFISTLPRNYPLVKNHLGPFHVSKPPLTQEFMCLPHCPHKRVIQDTKYFCNLCTAPLKWVRTCSHKQCEAH